MGLINRKLSGKFNGPEAQKGAATAELAISAPLLAIMILGVVEFGKLFQTHTMVTKNIENGARFISDKGMQMTGTFLNGDDISTIKNLIVYGNAAGNGDAYPPGMTTGDISVYCTFGGTAAGTGTRCNREDNVSAITIDLTYTYTPFYGSTLLNFSGADLNIPLNASVTIPVVS